jgi:hypothetical protein
MSNANFVNSPETIAHLQSGTSPAGFKPTVPPPYEPIDRDPDADGWRRPSIPTIGGMYRPTRCLSTTSREIVASNSRRRGYVGNTV